MGSLGRDVQPLFAVVCCPPLVIALGGDAGLTQMWTLTSLYFCVFPFVSLFCLVPHAMGSLSLDAQPLSPPPMHPLAPFGIALCSDVGSI